MVGIAMLRGEGQGVSYPDQWASEVRPYVDIVEDERDLAFLHPISVEFLPAEDFRREVTADKAELTDEEREEIEQGTSLLRAVGLIEGEIDLFEAVNDLAGAGIIGYYSFEDELIRIRGTTLTPAVKSTLVHELTHALQDQHFNLEDRQDAFEDASDSAGGTAFDALVEGDASRIETAYRHSLSDAEQAELDKDQAADSSAYRKSVTEIPEILQTFSHRRTLWVRRCSTLR